jgi:hypothetical protein
MITLLNDLPSNMVGFKASGKVTREDFQNTVMPAVDALVRKTGELNYLLLLDTSLSDFSIGAWMQDLVLGAKHLLQWNRVAIVSDVKSIRSFTNLYSHVIPGEFKGFSHEQLDEAVAWTAGTEGARQG